MQCSEFERLDLLGRDCWRYSDEAFPAYRFLPGLTPHPTRHPEGHSYGLEAASPTPWPAHRWAASSPYLYGCDLYNRGFWWEAHEAWESLWQVTRDQPQQHRHLQGLIQTANAQLKLALGRAQAVRRVWGKAETHWQEAALPERFMGLALAEWRRRTQRYLEQCLAQSPLRHNLTDYPRLELQNDAD